MSEVEEYTPSTDEIKASATRLGAWAPDAFDRWLAAHDARVRREYAKLLSDRIRRLRLDNAPATPDPQSVAYANGLNHGRREARRFLVDFVERGGEL